jgi:hypothetical protein
MHVLYHSGCGGTVCTTIYPEAFSLCMHRTLLRVQCRIKKSIAGKVPAKTGCCQVPQAALTFNGTALVSSFHS